MSLENIIRSLENGICPVELDYRPHEKGDNIDWDKVMYNLKYHQPHFYEDKFPPECKHIPAFDKIVELILDKNKDNSPLLEIEQRQENIINIHEEYEPSNCDTST
jgi:hypothetical protein